MYALVKFQPHMLITLALQSTNGRKLIYSIEKYITGAYKTAVTYNTQ